MDVPSSLIIFFHITPQLLLSSVTSPPLHTSHLSAMKISLSSHTMVNFRHASFLPVPISSHIPSSTRFNTFHLCPSAASLPPAKEQPSPISMSQLSPTLQSPHPSLCGCHFSNQPISPPWLISKATVFSLPLSQLWASVPWGLFEPRAYLSV